MDAGLTDTRPTSSTCSIRSPRRRTAASADDGAVGDTGASGTAWGMALGCSGMGLTDDGAVWGGGSA